MRVLAFGAHPDDMEILCAGTLAKYAQRGDHVAMAVVTDGTKGSETLPAEEISAIRHQEAIESAAVIGADLIWMGIEDQFIVDSVETRKMFIDVIRRVRPDVIFTNYPDDYYCSDHRLCGVIVTDIGIMVTQPNLETGHPAMDFLPQQFFMDTLAGVRCQPDDYVDITDTIEIKKEMLSKHKSQAGWLQSQYNMTPLEFVEIVAKFRGVQVGYPYAEAFTQVKAWPRMRGEKLLP